MSPPAGYGMPDPESIAPESRKHHVEDQGFSSAIPLGFLWTHRCKPWHDVKADGSAAILEPPASLPVSMMSQ